MATTRGYMLAATACDVLVFNSTTAKHRSLSFVERISLHEEDCGVSDGSSNSLHRTSISSSFGPSVRPNDVALLAVTGPNTAVVFDSKLTQSTESNFSITSFRLPV